jgi:prepilin-type N-terminal cleavage/methylation domain-containing protein
MTMAGTGNSHDDERGFTLLEILVSFTIIGILFAAQVGPFQQTIKSRDYAEQRMENTAAARTTLERLAEELTGAVPIAGEEGGFNLVDRSFDVPSSELRFATTAARRMRGDLIDPVSFVRYRLADDPWVPGARVLIKEQLPSVAAPGVEPVSAVILDRVYSFEAEVLPARSREWARTWSAAGNSDDLPRAIRFALSLDDGSDSPEAYRLTITLPMGPTR